jgi:hypothetical protein
VIRHASFSWAFLPVNGLVLVGYGAGAADCIAHGADLPDQPPLFWNYTATGSSGSTSASSTVSYIAPAISLDREQIVDRVLDQEYDWPARDHRERPAFVSHLNSGASRLSGRWVRAATDETPVGPKPWIAKLPTPKSVRSLAAAELDQNALPRG